MKNGSSYKESISKQNSFETISSTYLLSNLFGHHWNNSFATKVG